MLGLLRPWAGVANTGQELGKKIPRALWRWSRMGKSLLACFIWCYRGANLSYTENLIALKVGFSEEIFSSTTSYVNAISFNDLFLQPKLLYISWRNVSIQFWWLKYLVWKYSIQVSMVCAKRVLYQWTMLEN